MTNNNLPHTIEEKVNENKKYILLLIPVGIVSYLIKMHYFEPEIFLVLDSLGYFFYAADISVLGQLPKNYLQANNLWSIVLSLFFSSFHFENVIQYMDLQKYLSMIFSTITIIPIYFLCRKFFFFFYSIVGAIIFDFEPRLIQNSLLGIIEPLYILLGTITMLLVLNSNKKLVYLSFFCAALTALARSEGQVLFFVISIIFFVRFRNEKLTIPKYLIGLGIFLIILLPMLVHQIEVQETDLIFGRAVNTISYHTQDPNETGGESGAPFFIRGIENFSKYFIWD